MTRFMACLIVVLGCGSREQREAPPAPPVAPTAAVVPDEPVPVPDETGILVIPATKRDARDAWAGKGYYELRLGKGRIHLSLDEGSLVAPDAERGTAALEVLAKWLGVPVPPKTHSAPLVPLRFETIGLGDDQFKVFFQRGAEYGEMYINVRATGEIEFVPKDTDYAAALVDMFADALRDGPAGERTQQNDPNLASTVPVFEGGRDLETDGVHEPVCFADGWLVFKPSKRGEAVWFSKWGDRAPTQVCEIPGAVDGVAKSPRASHVGIVLTNRDPNSGIVGGEQTAAPWLVSQRACRKIETPKSVTLGPFTSIHLSPDGGALAFEARDGSLVTVPVEGGAVTRASVGDLDSIYAWDDDGIVLHNLEGGRSRVQPGKLGGKPTVIDRATVVSPDGTYTVALANASLDVTERASGAMRTFKPTLRSDVRAIARSLDDPPEWIGPHALVLRGSPDLVLDLETLRVRPLAAIGRRLVCASPDGMHALIEDDGVLVEVGRT